MKNDELFTNNFSDITSESERRRMTAIVMTVVVITKTIVRNVLKYQREEW